jgi:hypothetical protein
VGVGGNRHARGCQPSARDFLLPRAAAGYAAGPGNAERRRGAAAQAQVPCEVQGSWPSATAPACIGMYVPPSAHATQQKTFLAAPQIEDNRPRQLELIRFYSGKLCSGASNPYQTLSRVPDRFTAFTA